MRSGGVMSLSDLIALGFLDIKPMHGYEIVNFAKTRGLDVWAGVKMPSVYNALQRLDKKELISGEKITENNNPPRTVYTITAAGKKQLRKLLLKSFNKKNLLAQEFWLIVSFMANNISKNKFIEILNNRIDYLSQHIPNHEKMCNKLSDNLKYAHVPFYMPILMKMGIEIHEIELKKLIEIKQEILSGKQNHLFTEEEE